jgi:DNA (cytosine-5)-methyltransferase 1
MTVGSLFSGIGGFDLGFEQAGFTVAWQVEADAAARKVLRHRWPTVPIFDDVRTVGAHNLTPVDVLVGGFPCQDLSVAGKRAGLDGGRSGLFYELMRIAVELRPEWVVLENVPGLLTSHGGRDFHAVLATLAECGFHDRAYRILDSRYFGVAQRRRRVFIVGRAGAEFGRAAAVLLEQSRGGRDSAARGEAGARVAATLRGRSARPGVNVPGRGGEDDENIVTAWQSSQSGLRMHDTAATLAANMGSRTGHGVMQAPVAFNWQSGGKTMFGFGDTTTGLSTSQTPAVFQRHGSNVGPMGTLRAGNGNEAGGVPFIAATLPTTMGKGGQDNSCMDNLQVASSLSASMGHHGHSSPRGDGSDNLVPDLAPCLETTAGDYSRADGFVSIPVQAQGVRRLTPLECERLQGFPDGWTCLCPAQGDTATCVCPDSPRYKQCGNAVTVPVIRWIAARLAQVAAEARRVA